MLTAETDIIQLYREEVRGVPILLNYSPNSTLWAIQRHFPLSSNCTNHPGKDLVGRCHPPGGRSLWRLILTWDELAGLRCLLQ
jgi:hypothetical protein